MKAVAAAEEALDSAVQYRVRDLLANVANRADTRLHILRRMGYSAGHQDRSE